MMPAMREADTTRSSSGQELEREDTNSDVPSVVLYKKTQPANIIMIYIEEEGGGEGGAKETNSDSHLALLAYRSKPIDSNTASPAEMMFGRKIRTNSVER